MIAMTRNAQILTMVSFVTACVMVILASMEREASVTAQEPSPTISASPTTSPSPTPSATPSPTPSATGTLHIEPCLPQGCLTPAPSPSVVPGTGGLPGSRSGEAVFAVGAILLGALALAGGCLGLAWGLRRPDRN